LLIEVIQQMEKILTVQQAAELLQCKPQTVRNYLKAGKLPGRRIGKEWRIVEADVLAFVRGEIQTKTEEA
jgi:excisionase family DNA binding protein